MMQITVFRGSGRPLKSLSKDITDAVKMAQPKSLSAMGKMVTRQLKMEAPLWRGTLARSIHTRTLSENELGIFMAIYGPMLQTGHRITPGSVMNSVFAQWIFEKARGSPRFFARALIKKGHIDTDPWITRALLRVQGKLAQEAIIPIRKELNKRGFK